MNDISKVLFILLALAALVMVAVPLLSAWGMQQIQQNAYQRLLQVNPSCDERGRAGWWESWGLGEIGESVGLHTRLPSVRSLSVAQALLDFACFILLFSQIIPISLRVALDMAKIVYKLQALCQFQLIRSPLHPAVVSNLLRRTATMWEKWVLL